MTRTGFSSVALPNPLYNKLDAYLKAQDRYVTISEVVRTACWRFLEDEAS